MENECLNTIWHEYVARNGFCVKLRVDLEWDKEAFERLTEAMRACCKLYEISDEKLEELRVEAMQFVKTMPFSEEELDNLPPPATPLRLLPDWLAEIFWYLSHFVRDWTSHEAWSKDLTSEPEYFKKAYQRLDGLAWWFFWGRHPGLDEEQWWRSTHV